MPNSRRPFKFQTASFNVSSNEVRDVFEIRQSIARPAPVSVLTSGTRPAHVLRVAKILGKDSIEVRSLCNTAIALDAKERRRENSKAGGYMLHDFRVSGRMLGTGETTMIRSFGDDGSADIYNGKPTKAARKTLPLELHRVAGRKLDYLVHARSLDVLKSPPGNRLEALRGNWAGYWSIRINDQFRIVFQWHDDAAWDVQIVDYHS